MTDRLLLAQISVDVRDVQKQMQRAGFAVDVTSRRMAQTWRNNTQSMARDTEQFGRDVRRALASIALASVASDVTELADAWTRAGNQISAAAAATGTAGVSLSTIADIARDTRTEFEATATLYARLTRATGDLGVSQQQVIEATRLINQAFIAGGASAQEQSAAIIQLSQALSSGVLQGDELRSLRESSPLLLQAIAKEFGVAQGALKKLGAEGKLTSDRIFQAILKAAPQIEAQFSVTQSTLGDSFTNLRTSATEYVGTLNESLGVTDKLGGTINALADNFQSFADILIISIALLGARGIGGALNNATGNAIKYFASLRGRSAQRIKDLIAERDATVKTANEAAKAVEAERAILRKLEKDRDAANAKIFSSDKNIIQSRNLAAAQKALAAEEAALNRLLTSKKATQDQIDEATRRVTLAQANLNSVNKAASVDVARLSKLDQQLEATKNRLTAATTRAAQAQMSAVAAASALRATQHRLLAAGQQVLDIFGGPIGLAFIGVTAALAYFNAEAAKSERAVRGVNEALAILAEGYGVSAGLAGDAAAASAALTEELKSQRDAAEALAEIQRQDRRDTYVKALEDARNEVERLRAEISGAEGDTINFANAMKYNAFTPKDEFNEKLEKARQDLQDMTRYVKILEAGFAGLEKIGFEKPEVSTAIEAPAPAAVTESTSQTETTLKAELDAAARAADEAEALIEGIRETWRGYYEFKDAAIERELAETLSTINKSALAETQKIEARQMAEETAAAQRRELEQEKLDAIAEETAAREEAAQREIDLVARVMDERDRMLGRTLSIAAREFAARRAQIEAEIQDETRRKEALAALATEEAEFKRQAAASIAALDERSDATSQIARVKEIQEAKLAALQEYQELELDQLTDFEEMRRAIIEDSEAEIQAIRAASGLTILAGAEGTFGALASLASTFAGQQSGIFKALFFAEKAFALASAYVQMQLAIAKANASAPPPFNAPAILAAKVTGAAAIAGIVASTAAGFKKGGYTGDGDPNTVAGAVHRGEYVFDAKATKRIGKTNLEALRSGRPMPGTIAAPVAPSAARQVSFGDMILNVSGDGAAEIRDELGAMLSAHRRSILADIDRDAGQMMTREMNRKTPRFQRIPK